MSLSTIFQLDPGGQFYWWRNPEYPEKTTDLLKVSEKRYLVILAMSGMRTYHVNSYMHRLHRQL